MDLYEFLGWPGIQSENLSQNNNNTNTPKQTTRDDSDPFSPLLQSQVLESEPRTWHMLGQALSPKLNLSQSRNLTQHFYSLQQRFYPP